jgi:NAD(P)-dependent dehydrogenase (short-subunit alcohol dehydrogenase family)
MASGGGDAMRLQGKRVVVTGAAGGIGRAFCTALGKEGARLVCLDRDVAGLREVVEGLVDGGVEAIQLACDASDWAAVEAAAGIAVEKLGGIDVCVANAGGASGGQDAIPFLDITPTQWQAMVDRNLGTAFNTGLSFARKIAASGGGSIVFVTSQLAQVVRPGLAHYAAAKGGVHQLMRGMALDLIPHRVRVNAIAPGPIRHERNRAWFDRPAVKVEMLKYLPMGRTGMPEELAGALIYLASDESSFTTGTTITVDGGYTLV